MLLAMRRSSSTTTTTCVVGGGAGGERGSVVGGAAAGGERAAVVGSGGRRAARDVFRLVDQVRLREWSEVGFAGVVARRGALEHTRHHPALGFCFLLLSFQRRVREPCPFLFPGFSGFAQAVLLERCGGRFRLMKRSLRCLLCAFCDSLFLDGGIMRLLAFFISAAGCEKVAALAACHGIKPGVIELHLGAVGGGFRRFGCFEFVSLGFELALGQGDPFLSQVEALVAFLQVVEKFLVARLCVLDLLAHGRREICTVCLRGALCFHVGHGSLRVLKQRHRLLIREGRAEVVRMISRKGTHEGRDGERGDNKQDTHNALRVTCLP